MRTLSQILLTFLLNACWQGALIAALASLSARLARDSSARHRHWLWVAALILSVTLPAITSSQFSSVSFATVFPGSTSINREIPSLTLAQVTSSGSASDVADGAFLLNRSLALLLLGVYGGFLLYGVLRLIFAFYGARRLRVGSIDTTNELVAGLVEKCSISISGQPEKVNILISPKVPVPITLGVLTPVIILPEQLLSESEEMLTSGIGHELVHIKRRDYALNCVYELLYLPLSFHPGAALIRRRIRQTRELSCDELVAERIMQPEVYARSLVKLASAAPVLNRLSVITTVGIADADILEARVMSLLRKPGSHSRMKRLLLFACSLLLLVPCVAVASFPMRFDFAAAETGMLPQDPGQEKELKAKQRESELRERTKMSEEQFTERMKSDPKFREEFERKQELEIQMRALRQSALLNLARISMDQAIQIANSQTPGRVLECTLDGGKWKEPGVLDKDGKVFYRIVLISNEDASNGGATHVWVNAIDGTIIKTEKEMLRKRRPE